jgi:hypothetical protein
MTATPLLNIRDTLDSIRLASSSESVTDRRAIRLLNDQLQGQCDSAARRFASLNGWTFRSNGRPFGLREIALHGPRGTFHTKTTIFDHTILMVRHRRPAAIVCQPYSRDRACLAEAAALAELHDIALHVPPHVRASIHYPSWALFFVFTSRDHEIRWLPEQVVGIKPRVTRIAIVGRAEATDAEA